MYTYYNIQFRDVYILHTNYDVLLRKVPTSLSKRFYVNLIKLIGNLKLILISLNIEHFHCNKHINLLFLLFLYCL